MRSHSDAYLPLKALEVFNRDIQIRSITFTPAEFAAK